MHSSAVVDKEKNQYVMSWITLYDYGSLFHWLYHWQLLLQCRPTIFTELLLKI